MSSNASQDKGGLGCTILFLAPFVIGGIAGLVVGCRELYRTGAWSEDVVAALGVGTMFTLVGGGLLLAVLYGWREEKVLKQRQAQFPQEPWRWRQDWADQMVRCATPGGLLVYWGFCAAFGVAGAIVLFNLDEITSDGPLGYVALLFPLVACAMLAGAIYATLRWRKYGRSYCELLANPGVVGGWFRGLIWARVPVSPDGTVHTKLTCYHRYVTGSGKSRTTHRKVRWQETQTVAREQLALDPDGRVGIPVAYYVPHDCKPTTPAEPQDRIEWAVEANAEVPGIDFHTEFIVPLFWTEQSSTEPPPPQATANLDVKEYAFRPTVHVVEGIDSLELLAPPRRNLGVAFGMTFFVFIWTAIVAGMVYSGEVPIIFPIVFGAVDVLLLCGVVWIWFGKVRIRLEHGAVLITKSLLGFTTRSQVPFDQIIGMDTHVGMQSGNTPYYTIRLRTTTGKKDTIGGIRDKPEAKELIAKMQAFIDSA